MSQTAKLDKGNRPETPVRRVIRVFGSAKASAIVGLTTGAVMKWDRPRSKGGKGGLVPTEYQHKYLNAARAEGLELSADDFIAEPIE